MTQKEIVASLPQHLRPFVQVQDYGCYTAREQAVWRFILRQLTRRLRHTAHPVYLQGLEHTGIALDHIPSIDEMNACLAKLGWRAVVVDGFIPPAIFMEFQALKVLVIALDMRGVDQIFYTPAPDIVHESAGHAPFIVDVDYSEFLQRFGEIGMKAIASEQDFAQYEAVRQLSIVKAAPASTDREVAAAEAHLAAVMAADGEPSEAALLTRLHWWTVEYGLVGTVDDYRIFGAGLLSSLGESSNCLDDQRVRKIPLTVAAVTCPYDITREQPQLFVTSSCRHLSQVLEEFAGAMCFQRGGAESLAKAVAAATVCTARYDSGVQVSGRFVEVLCDAVGNAIYLRTDGPTQLAWRDTEIYGHGTEAHAQGFGSPVGLLKDFSRCLSQYSIDELKAHNIVLGDRVCLEFLSGITVRGRLEHVLRQEQRNLLLGFEDCTVTDLHGRVLFAPSWGRYDMAVGVRIDSVYGGTADRERYQLYKAAPATTTVRTAANEALQSVYADIAGLVGAAAESLPAATLANIERGLDTWPDEWLLRAELLAVPGPAVGPVIAALRQRAEQDLRNLAQARPQLADIIALALDNNN